MKIIDDLEYYRGIEAVVRKKIKKDASTIDMYKVVDFLGSKITTTKDWRQILNQT